MSEERLDRLENKLDRIADDVTAIKLTLAEYRGAGKAVHILASVFGAAAGFLAAKFGHHP